jgi:serine/threonine protein kinase/Tfp pilus assembly protein PilF
MSSGQQCKECGAPIPSGSPGGLCGKCLFGLGLEPAQGLVDPTNSASGAAPEGAALPKFPTGGEAEAPRCKPANIVIKAFTEKPGDTIGHYRLLQEIGQGGFGVVYMAQQQEPIKRRVALKIVKLGMDTKQVMARFEAERQALALMDHPNIAKVLDAGATASGRPFFVMELVKGVRITEYCDQNHLSTPERLELFIQICRAVQHAHQKGIIHRDLKPSNILVTLHDGVPVPKIIDFGIAKATQQELTDQTVFTQFGHFLGTPAYVSPEQAEMSGLDVDTRSDIYSLGVLLYELLTGKTPFDSKELLAAGLDEMRRTIREKEPARPSTRLSTLQAAELTTMARHRRIEPPKLVRLIRGDLDWIVMKCLEKDRTRRYETAVSFAADLEHFLKNEPISARAPSAGYRLQKLVRRNKLVFTASAAVSLAVVSGLVVSTWMFLREREARRQSQQVALLLENMLRGIDPSVAQGRDTQLLREVLDKTVEQVAIELKNDPQVESELFNTIGEVYRAIGQSQMAEQMYRLSLSLQGKPSSAERGRVAKSLDDLAMALKDQGRLREAESVEREALRLRRDVFGPDSVEVATSLNDLGTVLRIRASLPEAEATHRQALAIQRKLFPGGNLAIAVSLNNLALTLREAGKYADAETSLREALSIEKSFLGENNAAVTLTLDSLAFVMLDRGAFSQAEELDRQALELLRKHFGQSNPNDPNVATGINNLGLILSEEGHLEEAEAMCQQALEMRRKIPGHELEVAASLDDVSQVLRKRKQLSKAEPLAREALAMRKRLLGDDHPAVAASLDDLASVLQDEKQWVDAEKDFHDALAIQQSRYGMEHPLIATTLNDLALLLRDEGKLLEAEQTMRTALAMREKLLGEQHPAVARSRKDLNEIVALARTDRPPETQAADMKGTTQP